MPYKSLAQAALFHSDNSPVSKSVVAEYDRASKGKMGRLPKHVTKGKSNGKETLDRGRDQASGR